ncbi:hypothetical protein ACFFRR_005213 [Megaselia abdita]
MKVFVVLFAVVAAACAGTIDSPFEAQGRSISSSIEDAITDFRDQMPCGFESLGIGPLAPARISEQGVDFQRQSFGVEGEVHDLVLYGLNKFNILKCKANAITSKVQVTLDWPEEIKAEITNYILKSFVKQRGLTVNLVGDGLVDFALQGLTIDLNLKYSLSIVTQKIKIKELKVVISLNDCVSHITGLLGDGFVNRKINEFICEFILVGLNDNQQGITNNIEDTVKPILNKFLEEHPLSELVGGGNGEPKPVCVPPQ